jgi:hypothetical protein
LCFASPYVASQKSAGSLPACTAPYALTSASLKVTPDSTVRGYSSNYPGPDPTLAGYPSSQRDSPIRTVLLGGLGGSPSLGERYVVGPSQMRLSAADVESASVHKTRTGQWIVNVLLSPAGATTFDRVARVDFHQYLAIDMGGKIVSAPLMQPTQASFSSFNGVMEISGPLTASNARAVAAAVKG